MAQQLTKSEKISLDIAEIARRVRADLKEQVPECRFSVTIQRYSMGRSLDIVIKSGPFEPHVWGHDGLRPARYLTPECKAVIDRVRTIANQYNFDDSEPQTDYFNYNFALDIHIAKWPKDFIKTEKKG